MSRKRKGPTPFSTVLDWVGRDKPIHGGQNEKRHYSEVFSQDVAEWVAGYLVGRRGLDKVLPPEAPVRTAFGKKRLDVGAVDHRDYLVVDISIKTFNFTDSRSGNYKKNYTGRFYELLGESMDLHHTYAHAVLVALIFLPEEALFDGTTRAPSSFGSAVKQYSKIAGRAAYTDEDVRFEHVYVGVHSTSGDIFFVDATRPPPKQGMPPLKWQLTPQEMFDEVLRSVEGRGELRRRSQAVLGSPFRWLGEKTV